MRVGYAHEALQVGVIGVHLVAVDLRGDREALAVRIGLETVGVDQSVLGRLLNYGTVTVRGTGGSFEPIRQIEDPLTFRSYITAG